MSRHPEMRCRQLGLCSYGRGWPLLATSSVLALLLAAVQPLAAQTVDVNSPGSLTAQTGTTTPANGAVWNLNSTGIFLNTNLALPTGTPGLTINGNGNTLTLNNGAAPFGLFVPPMNMPFVLNLSDVTISGGSHNNGGAISSGANSFTINTTGAVAFTDNTAPPPSFFGGAIYSPEFTSIGSAGSTVTFSGNTAGGSGGAIYGEHSITLDGSTINLIGNTTGSFGGAIFNLQDVLIGDASSTVTVSGNVAGSIGGAIASRRNVTINGSAITMAENTGTTGGAIYANGIITVNATGPGLFSDNSARGQGGAIWDGGGVTLNVTGGGLTFSGNMENTATTAQANAIYLDNTAGATTATFNAAAGSTITFFDPIQGNATHGLITVTKTGAGTVAFDGSLYTNPTDQLSQVYANTTVQEGTFEVRNNAVYGALAADVSQTVPSSFTVDSGATLAGGMAGEVRADDFALNGTLNIAGSAPPGNASGGFSTFTVTSNNVSFGTGSQVLFNTYLNDASVQRTDLLTLNLNGSATSGTAGIFVTNVGGPGGLTTGNGIQLVQTNNGTTAGAFTLANPELRGGAFDYRLFQGGPDGSDPNNWYLRSTFVEPPVPPVPPEPAFPPTPPAPGPGTFPIIGPEIATYGVVQPMAQQLGRAMLGTHDERLGDLYPPHCEPAETNAPPYSKAPPYTKAPTDCGAYGWRPAVWGRLFGQQIDNHYQAFADPRTDGQIAGFQAGVDVLRSDSLFAGHSDYAGFYAAYGNANVDVSGLVTNAATTGYVLQHTGHLNLNAYSGGVYWTHYGVPGWYVDLTLQGTSYGGAASTEFASLNTNGSGFISSLEAGYPIALPMLGPSFVLEPQAQMLWQWVSFDSGNDGLGPVALGTSSETTARVGLKGKWTIATDSGQVWQPYVRVNFWSDFGPSSATLFGPDIVPLISHAQYMDVDTGFTTKINTHLSAFADAGYQFAVSNDGGGKRNGVKASAGLRYQW